MLPTPAELREQWRRYLKAAPNEVTPELKRRLANYALALVQLAEQIERDERIADDAGLWQSAGRWQWEAAECRAVAVELTMIPSAQASYRQLAESYDAMAARIEELAAKAAHKREQAAVGGARNASAGTPAHDAGLGRARRWRLKAEELRTVADQMKAPRARESLRRIAAVYDALADRQESGAKADRGSGSAC